MDLSIIYLSLSQEEYLSMCITQRINKFPKYDDQINKQTIDLINDWLVRSIGNIITIRCYGMQNNATPTQKCLYLHP